MSRGRISRSRQRKIARERIAKLLSMAARQIPERPERARRYVRLSRKISMRCKVRFPGPWKRRICQRCDLPLIPGTNCTIRVRQGRVNITCQGCGMVHRYPYPDDKY